MSKSRRLLLLAAIGVVSAPAGWHYVMAGNTDGLVYPGKSPYVLPWIAGSSHMCAQGNDSRATHTGHKYRGSWDFFMWPGTPIHAARAGIVESVEDHHGDWPGFHAGNMVTIRHDDGSLAVYGHLLGDGMKVSPGQLVQQRQVVGEAGLSGPTLFPHLHFHVEDRSGNAVAVSFFDVDGNGVPHLWGIYRAGAAR